MKTKTRNNYFYGIYGIRFINRGDWNDPEIIWHNRTYNYYDLEESLLSAYNDNLQELPFEKWVSKNAYLSRNILQLLSYE